MRKVALRGLLAHKLRMVMTLGAVAVGVAFVAGVLVLSDSMQRSFDDLFATVYEGTDAVVRSDESIEGGMGPMDLRGTVDEALLDTLRDPDQVPTVETAHGEVEGIVQLLDEEGEPAGGGPLSGPTSAASIDPSAGSEWDDSLPFGVREGHWPEADDEIVVDVATERNLDYGIGDTVPVLSRSGVNEYRLVGTIGFGSADSPAGQSIVLLTTSEAQRTLGEPGRLSTISVVATEGTSQEEVVSDIEAVVGDSVEVLTGEEAIEEIQSDLRDQLRFITIGLLAFAVVAVVVGAFVIYNSFSIVVAQRAREMALLRAVGATRAQVLRSVLVEGALTGLVGSAAGFLVGLGLAALLGAFAGIEGGVTILPSAVIIALLVGLTVTVLSSLIPAWRASRVAPVAAMRDIAVDTAGRSLVRVILGLAISGLGVLLVLSGALTGTLLVAGFGAVLTLVGVIFLAPALARPVGSWLGWPIGRLRGITGTLARQNAARNPRRTAATALALTIGVGVVTFFLVFHASMRSSFEKIVDDSFAVDFAVRSPGSQGFQLGMPPEVAQDVDGLEEVEQATPMRFASATVEDDTAFVTATSPRFFDAFGIDVDRSDDLPLDGLLGPGQVVVRDYTAEDDGLAVGDTVTIDFLDAEPATLEVAGIYDPGSGTNDFGGYILGIDELAQYVADPSDHMVLVHLASGVDPDDARDPIESVVAEVVPTAEVQDSDDLKEQVASQLDRLLAVALALLLFSIGVAVFGILNAMALSVLERTREIGLLRAVGMTRPQLRASVRWESAVVAVFGAVLGMAVGVLGGWAMITALQDEGFEVFTLPYLWLIAIAVLAGVLGVGAAWWPAWRASELNVLDAIHHA